MEKEVFDRLIGEALAVRRNSYAPYSNYSVGAALLSESGIIYTGCNIENAAYTPSNCAERTAFFKAVSEGERAFSAIAIVGGSGGTSEKPRDFCPPCGVCRQVMAEFCDPDSFLIVLAVDRDHYHVHTLSELLPESFSPAKLCGQKPGS